MANTHRVEYLDIAKGLGILFVVWAHARGPYSGYMYQFHMPLFFLISGYLFNERTTVKDFILRKVKTLYFPFVFWNVLCITLKYLFHIQNYSPRGYIKTVAEVFLTIGKDGQFLGATWFLGALFVVSIWYKVMDSALPKRQEKHLVLLAFFGTVAVIGFSITLPYMISRTLILSLFFAAGRTVRCCQQWLKFYDTKIMALFAILLFVIIGRYNSANMGANQYTSPILFVIGAFFAGYGVIAISRFLEQKSGYIKKLLLLMGKESLSILIWQFVVFRIVIAIQLYLNDIPLRKLLDYFPCYSTQNGWWFAYFLVGVFASLLVGWIIKQTVHLLSLAIKK